ncbi:cobyrinic acid a,c-diamide synthase [Parafrankia sp. EAN1pec]|uniref:cobyrinate a,c-diamide synthase n=1 Tax=Parafrankia sp. (strain EAN1pec) TaxID=298653 RepID=UPI0000544316|nr:cobyrinic acid a,c-diamide synthase [Frankia sp. EAN1pec]
MVSAGLIPRLVLAAPASGAGKTTVATGLMAALTARGLRVSGHKVGPDYIDPGYHALATGRPGRNLDAVLCGPDLIGPLFAHGAAGAQLAVVEGVMGLFDGVAAPAAGQEADHGSTAHVARLLDAPVVLVVDAAGAGRSVAALVCGFAAFDRRVRLAGVILNRVGSDRHRQILTGALAGIGVAVLGAVPRDGAVHTPSRHLGLVPAAERAVAAAQAVRRLGVLVGAAVDLDALIRLASSAPPLPVDPWDPARQIAQATATGAAGRVGQHTVNAGAGGVVPGGRPVRIAVAGGAAFTFGYTEHVELLTAAGAQVLTVDPLRDETLPDGTDALVVGGGFPEEHAGALAANSRLRGQVAALAARGAPLVAECAGLLYLGRSLDGTAMCGVLDTDAVMGPRLTLGYRHAVAAADSPLVAAGTVVTAHEFHRTRLSVDRAELPGTPAWQVDIPPPRFGDSNPAAGAAGAGGRVDGGVDGTAAGGRPEGFVRGGVHASYLHLHWAGLPAVPARLVAAAGTARTRPSGGTPPAGGGHGHGRDAGGNPPASPGTTEVSSR